MGTSHYIISLSKPRVKWTKYDFVSSLCITGPVLQIFGQFW